jgi:hypothetical protein
MSYSKASFQFYHPQSAELLLHGSKMVLLDLGITFVFR